MEREKQVNKVLIILITLRAITILGICFLMFWDFLNNDLFWDAIGNGNIFDKPQ